MIKKIMDFEFLAEAIILGLVLVLLLIVFCRVVIPNFGNKSLPASWMAMFGAFVIFCYSVFIELQDEVFSEKFSTFVCTYEGMNFPNLEVPCDSRTHTGISELGYEKNIVYIGGDKVTENLIDAGQELVLLNLITFVTSDYKDWKRENYFAYGTGKSHWRNPGMAGEDEVIYQKDILSKLSFEFFKYESPSPTKHEDENYVILPPESRITVDKDIVTLEGEHYSIKMQVFPLDSIHTNQNQAIKSTGYEVRIACNLLKKRSGSFKKPEYKKFCQQFTNEVKSRIAVAQSDFPEYLN